MKFKPDTVARVHEQMALVKAQSTGGCLTNYFRQEMLGPQILTAATARSVLVANDEHEHHVKAKVTVARGEQSRLG
jgi:hypothetical protein